eukprot:Unigene6934_Nuclearia_a/m.21238 Unigene6934_Nuclearia_a/g.21238  ORF Unigene6934_Nuclearia_a/g.21238 Unigene6934_Nuclearia_a/m.21238 type:complete len:463 (-) Unigene6934_Nuclearia_a:382-1770(-)
MWASVNLVVRRCVPAASPRLRELLHWAAARSLHPRWGERRHNPGDRARAVRRCALSRGKVEAAGVLERVLAHVEQLEHGLSGEEREPHEDVAPALVVDDAREEDERHLDDHGDGEKDLDRLEAEREEVLVQHGRDKEGEERGADLAAAVAQALEEDVPVEPLMRHEVPLAPELVQRGSVPPVAVKLTVGVAGDLGQKVEPAVEERVKAREPHDDRRHAQVKHLKDRLGQELDGVGEVRARERDGHVGLVAVNHDGLLALELLHLARVQGRVVAQRGDDVLHAEDVDAQRAQQECNQLLERVQDAAQGTSQAPRACMRTHRTLDRLGKRGSYTSDGTHRKYIKSRSVMLSGYASRRSWSTASSSSGAPSGLVNEPELLRRSRRRRFSDCDRVCFCVLSLCRTVLVKTYECSLRCSTSTNSVSTIDASGLSRLTNAVRTLTVAMSVCTSTYTPMSARWLMQFLA